MIRKKIAKEKWQRRKQKKKKTSDSASGDTARLVSSTDRLFLPIVPSVAIVSRGMISKQKLSLILI